MTRENWSSGFPTRSNTNRAVQLQKMVRDGRNFGFRKKRGCTIYETKTKGLISCAVTAQLICGFVFAYAKGQISHDTAHIDILFRSVNSFFTVNLKSGTCKGV